MSPSTEFIPFARPSLGEAEEQAVLRVLRSGWLTTAREAEQFEQEFASYCGVSHNHTLAVSSATAGLHLALEALGVRSGDRVAVSPYTFAASAEVVRYLGADPVFVDIEPGGFNIDPAKLLETLERQSEAGSPVHSIMPVHVGGYPCPVAELRRAAERYGAAVVEDAAHSFPAREPGAAHGATHGAAHSAADGEPPAILGTGSDAGVFSFYATKPITTGEGGMLVFKTEDAAARARVMRLHGIDRPVWDRYHGRAAPHEYEVVAPGYKYNLPDILAAIGRVQLRRAEEFNRRRAAIAAYYLEHLADLDQLQLPPHHLPQSWHLFILRLDRARVTVDRDTVIAALAEAGVGTSVHYKPLHLMPYYRDRYGLSPEDFPVSWDAYQCCLSLPIYPQLSDAAVERVVEAVRSVCRRYARA